jgi:replication factor A1
MPLDDIIQRILSAMPNLTREEVLRLIEEKEKNAKGFLTTESAARALAIELGVEASEDSWKHGISIADLVSGLGNVTVIGRVISVHPLRKFVRQDGKEGMMRHLTIADKTGGLKVTLWGELAVFPNVEKAIGQIAKISHGYVRRGFDGKIELSVDSRGAIEFSPSGIPEAEYPPLTRFFKRINEIRGDEKSVNVLGTISRVYPATTFSREDGIEGKVRRVELEDGGNKITVVLWDKKVEDLADIEEGRFLAISEAKVRRHQNDGFELHVSNSTSIVMLTEKPSDFECRQMGLTKIRDLTPKKRNITVLARVAHIGKARNFTMHSGEIGLVATLLINDESGSIQLNLWQEKARLSEQIQVGDIILIENAYTAQGTGGVSLNLDTGGSFTLNPHIDGAENLPRYEE